MTVKVANQIYMRAIKRTIVQIYHSVATGSCECGFFVEEGAKPGAVHGLVRTGPVLAPHVTSEKRDSRWSELSCNFALAKKGRRAIVRDGCLLCETLWQTVRLTTASCGIRILAGTTGRQQSEAFPGRTQYGSLRWEPFRNIIRERQTKNGCRRVKDREPNLVRLPKPRGLPFLPFPRLDVSPCSQPGFVLLLSPHQSPSLPTFPKVPLTSRVYCRSSLLGPTPSLAFGSSIRISTSRTPAIF